MMEIHDHFNGSAHCLECQGPCRLSGQERAMTEFIRFTLERIAFSGGKLSTFQTDALRDLGVDPELFLLRARFTVPRTERAWRSVPVE